MLLRVLAHVIRIPVLLREEPETLCQRFVGTAHDDDAARQRVAVRGRPLKAFKPCSPEQPVTANTAAANTAIMDFL